MTLRFIGNKADVGGTKLTRFGQVFQLPDDVAAELVTNPAAKLPALPDTDFSMIGFTSRELELYQFPSAHADAPEAFLNKKRAALSRLTELRSGAKKEN
jgi:hypothetical protein